MPAPLFTTVTTPPKIARGEDHQPVFKVIVLTFLKLLCFFHHSKHERRARPAGPARRPKPTLEIFPIEKIINISEEPQLPSIITQRQRIARPEIGFGESFESIPATCKRPRIEDRTDVITRRREIKIDQHTPANMLRGHNRELMIRNHE